MVTVKNSRQKVYKLRSLSRDIEGKCTAYGMLSTNTDRKFTNQAHGKEKSTEYLRICDNSPVTLTFEKEM